MTQLPEVPFFLFGMGGRRKWLYKDGAFADALTGQVVRRWEVAAERIVPAEYAVHLETKDGHSVSIVEEEEAVWIETDGERECLSQGHVSLPTFEGHRRASVLCVLHQEMLVNIVNGAPVPNLLVYRKPWYRDAAMVCMCLEKTGNLHLVADWILGLNEPFDRNNADNCEPDNLGQALYMISLVSDASHPLVKTILKTVPEFRAGSHIVGITDGAEHPVYQTKWLKYGLARLGEARPLSTGRRGTGSQPGCECLAGSQDSLRLLEDPYEIPSVFDPYSALFWMDYKEQHVHGPRFGERSRERYPYLGWAEDHFFGEPPGEIGSGLDYPLTWESCASEADYPSMSVVSDEYVRRKMCAPHTWHAAEMFLYLLECE